MHLSSMVILGNELFAKAPDISQYSFSGSSLSGRSWSIYHISRRCPEAALSLQ